MFTRRTVLNGAAAIGAGLAGASLLPSWARAQSAATDGSIGPRSEFDLHIGETPFAIGRRRGVATTINATLPGPLLRWREGDDVTLRVTNGLDATSSIHWHGILLPNDMDGVPGVTFDGIAPGETFTYRFPVRQSGTYWYHSHSRFQEQTGVYGPIIIDPAGGERIAADREYVVVLSDWSFENPERIFANLKRHPDYYNYNRRTLSDFLSDASRNGLGATIAERRMWAEMRMTPTDIADVTGATYTYLMNGQGPDANWTALFNPGERVRLRFINASAMTYFDVRIPGLPMTVTAADGVDVEPVETDEFRIAVAETYDVVVEPAADRAYAIFAESMDRSGHARGTLAARHGLVAAAPTPRAPPVRSMADMGHGGHVGHDMSAPADPPHAGHDMSAMDMTTMETAAPARAAGHEGHDMGAMPEGDPHAGHDMSDMAETAAAGHEGHNMSATAVRDPHAGHAMAAMDAPAGEALPSSGAGVRAGPGVAMRADAPFERLDDPGIGLGEDGWRVLSYAQLRGVSDVADPRPPARDLTLHLTSNMERYMWSFDGVRFSEVDGPIRFEYGERLQLSLVNDTMMEHPIHLHGMFVELDNGAGARRPLKHTLNIKPGERVRVILTADEPGDWAFHCHLLYHMEAGMMRVVTIPAPGERS